MDREIIIAVIGGIATLITAVLAYLSGRNKEHMEFLVWKQKVIDAFETINKKLDEHNSYADKFAKSQKSISRIEKEQIIMRKDIEYLKEGVKNANAKS